jgi:hypothetical protein
MDVPLETPAAARSCSKSDNSKIPDSANCLNPFRQLESPQTGAISGLLLFTPGILDKCPSGHVAAPPLAGSNAVVDCIATPSLGAHRNIR